MKIYVGVDEWIHAFFTSALVGGEWSASRPCRFTLRGKSRMYPIDRRLGGPYSRSGRYAEVKNLILPRIEFRILCRPARNHSLCYYATESHKQLL
jgi:hypothetical protein